MKFLLFTSFAIILVIEFNFSSPAYSEENKKNGEEHALSDLAGGSPEKVRRALELINSRKPVPLIPGLVKLFLESEDRPAREAAYTAIKFFNKKEILLSWIDMLEKTNSFALKLDIIDYISDLDDKRMIIPLTKELAAPFYLLRKKSASLLKKIGDDRMYPFILAMAENQSPVTRIYALEALFYLYDKRFNPVLLDFIKDGNKSVRIYTINCIQKNDLAEMIPNVRELALNDSVMDVRVHAIQALANFNDRNSLYIFLGLLSHADVNVRRASIDAIVKLGVKSTAYQLSIQLQNENDEENRFTIIDTLIKFRSPSEVAGLRKILLGDANSRLRIMSAHALGVLRDDRVPGILKECLGDRDLRVRGEIAASLGMYNPGIVSEMLIEIIKGDRSRYVRSAALYSLKRLYFRKSLLPLFSIYSEEKDPIFADMVKKVIIDFISRFV